MNTLEKRFYQQKHPVIISADHPSAKIIIGVLAKGLRKGNFILRSGISSKYDFQFDLIYG